MFDVVTPKYDGLWLANAGEYRDAINLVDGMLKPQPFDSANCVYVDDQPARAGADIFGGQSCGTRQPFEGLVMARSR
jgi:hypothetical protein